MARQRIIQPEFWSDGKISRLSLRAKVLFIGLWSFSDDGGVHPDDVVELRLRVFPGDLDATDDAISGCLDELVRHDLVLRWTSQDGGNYLHVRNWTKHQKIRKPYFRHPQYSTSTVPVPHQYRTSTVPVRAESESESESETLGREEGTELHRHVAATRANSSRRANSPRQRTSDRDHDPPPPPT